MNISMKVNKFLESEVYNELDSNVQLLLKDLIDKLKDLDFIINKRNEPALVLKGRLSQSNIATIRLRQSYITVGPYKNYNENPITCRCKEDISEQLITDIKAIYREKENKW